MKYLLDANVVIMALTATGSALKARMAACDEDDMVTSSIAFAEVAHGSVHGKPPPFERLEQFAQGVPVLDFDYNAARAYATLPFRRASYDRLIAAHALSRGLTLVTNNVAHFADVPGLKVENWTLPL